MDLKEPSEWMLGQDFLICNVILQHGCEGIVPCVDWVQEMFTPLPAALVGRTFSEIKQRIETLQPTLQRFLKSKKRFSGAELFRWLQAIHSVSEPGFSFEEDMEICKEVRKAWFQLCAPSLAWFSEKVVGVNPVLTGRSGQSLFARYTDVLRKEMEASIIGLGDNENPDVEMHKEMHSPEPPLKKILMRYSFKEDKCICLAVARAMYGDAEQCPIFGPHWFQVNLIDSGLIVSRSHQSLYGRFKNKLESGISEAFQKARAASVSQAVVLSLQLIEEFIVDWLTLLHEKDCLEEALKSHSVKDSDVCCVKVVRP